MSSTYSGNPGNISLLSPLTIQAVSDGDALNAASVNIPVIKLADYLEALRQGSTFAPGMFTGHIYGGLATGTQYWVPPGHSVIVGSAYLQNTGPIQMPFACVLRNLRAGFNLTISGGAVNVFLIKNGATQSLTCTIAAGGQYASDTTHSVSVAAGDNLTMSVQTTAGYSAGTGGGFGFAVQYTSA